ncbi:hypothetical protein [Crossiella sp. NPDC003009]
MPSTQNFAQAVSRRLKKAGHTLVFPDRRREGISVRRAGPGEATVTVSIDHPEAAEVSVAELVADLSETLTECGYAFTVTASQDDYASIRVFQGSHAEGNAATLRPKRSRVGSQAHKEGDKSRVHVQNLSRRLKLAGHPIASSAGGRGIKISKSMHYAVLRFTYVDTREALQKEVDDVRKTLHEFGFVTAHFIPSDTFAEIHVYQPGTPGAPVAPEQEA